MSRKSQLQKILKEMESLLESNPDLQEAIKSIEPVLKDSGNDEDYKKIKLPYVSAKPIRSPEWNT